MSEKPDDASPALWVRKEDGSEEPFSFARFSASLQKGGLKPTEIEGVRGKIEAILYPGIPTREVYRVARRLLRQLPGGNPAVYSLKKALLDLGPDGFRFEKLMARLLTARGYSTEVGLVLEGQCVSHEIDILAFREGECLIGECKFRNMPGIQVDVKVPLYIRSRFEDVAGHPRIVGGGERLSSWIFTNSRFSGDAARYATCRKINLLGWDFPGNSGLRNWIDESGLYPLTVLQSLTRYEKKTLLDKDFLLAEDVRDGDLSFLTLSPARRKTLENELRTLWRN